MAQIAAKCQDHHELSSSKFHKNATLILHRWLICTPERAHCSHWRVFVSFFTLCLRVSPLLCLSWQWENGGVVQINPVETVRPAAWSLWPEVWRSHRCPPFGHFCDCSSDTAFIPHPDSVLSHDCLAWAWTLYFWATTSVFPPVEQMSEFEECWARSEESQNRTW